MTHLQGSSYLADGKPGGLKHRPSLLLTNVANSVSYLKQNAASPGIASPSNLSSHGNPNAQSQQFMRRDQE